MGMQTHGKRAEGMEENKTIYRFYLASASGLGKDMLCSS